MVAGRAAGGTLTWPGPADRLIERFHNNVWQKNMSKLAALREAQLWMLRSGGKAESPGKPNPARLAPYYWAAFILSGDWR
jgi:CHAT domain-containing protein